MTTVGYALTCVLAGVLLWAGGVKAAVAREQFRVAVESWGVPAQAVRPLAWGIPAWELAVGGVAGLAALSGRLGAPAAWLLAGTFALFLAIQLGIGWRRPAAECGCFGRPARLSRATISRTAILFGIAIVAAFDFSGLI